MKKTASDCSRSVSRHLLVTLTALGLSTSPTPAQISFTDVSAAAKVDTKNESFGASWGDLDGDGYPDIHVNNHRMQDSLFLNRGDGTFLDVATQVRTWAYRASRDTHGSSWADIEGDGDQDLLESSGIGGPMQLLVNEHGRLIERASEFGLSALMPSDGRQPIWLDFDGDGQLDFVMVYGGASRLFRKNSTGDGFLEETTAYKVACTNSHYAQLYEATEDGHLDFLCPSESLFPQKIYDTLPFPWVKVFDNTKPTSLFPLVPHVVDSVNADFDNDGRLDTFVLGHVTGRPSSVIQGGSRYFEAHLMGGTKGFKFKTSGTVTFVLDWNKADEGTQVDLAKIRIGAGGMHPDAIPFTLDPDDPNVRGMPPAPTTTAELPSMQIGYDKGARRWTAFIQTTLGGQADNIFSEAYAQVTTSQPLSNLQSTGLWKTDKPAAPTLLMNFPGNRTDQTVAAGLDAPVQCGSAVAGDFDNDMDMDLYLACRTGASNIANILYANQGDGTFVEVPEAGGAAGPIGLYVRDGVGAADSVVTADYDVDGFLDLFVTNGFNLRPLSTGAPNSLFRNQGNANHWVEIDLVATQSVRDAVGARIYATANDVTQLRWQDGGYHRWSQNLVRSHFGLADATTVDLQIIWPSGTIENYDDVAADQLYRITEGAGIAPVVLGNAPAYPCGPPSPALAGGSEIGVFVWRECVSGEWKFRTAAGGGDITYQGKITSSAPYTKVTRVSTGSGDVVDDTTNPSQIMFSLVTRFSNTKGVNFTAQDGSSTCMQIDAPGGAQVFMGPLRKPVTQPFDIETQEPCTPQ